MAVAVALAAGGCGGGGAARPNPSASHASALVAEVTKLLGGIPQAGNTLGSPTAPVTLQYFADLECPFCREFSLVALPALIERYVRTGTLKIEYRSLQAATHDSETFHSQQLAALAAGKQNLMWQYIELFYEQQGREGSGYVTESYLRGLARQVPGLNFGSWLAARRDPELVSALTTDAEVAINERLAGTPSFDIGKTGGALRRLEYLSPTDPTLFAKEIEVLARS